MPRSALAKDKSDVRASVRALHSALGLRGFCSQFVGSMIQYRHPKMPEVSLGLAFDEDPYRLAGKHGQFRYKLTNTTFVADDAVREKAQQHLNDLQRQGLVLEADFDVLDFKGTMTSDALKTMADACREGIVLREAFKTYLKAVHDWLKTNETKPTKVFAIGTENATDTGGISQRQNQITLISPSKKSGKR